MKKLNLIKILKDCPKGTKFYSPVYGKIEFIRIETFENNPDPITIKWFKDENTTYLEYLRADGTFRGLGECIIFPSEEQRDWSKWQRPFVKGDILVSEVGNIVLCSHIDENQLVHYHCLLNFLDILKIRDDIGVGYSHECTLANDFQKQKLFDALKKEGYEWDAEKKELKPLQEFKDGDIVATNDGKYIAIIKNNGGKYYVCCHPNVNYFNIDRSGWFDRLATDEEKQILFDAIKENGYKWNDKTKTLEKLIVPKFKVGDKIHIWTIQDAKEGDVLAINWYEGYDYWEKIIIFKKYHNEGANSPCVEGYGNTFKNRKLVFNDEVPYFSKTWTSCLEPATKEQRDFLFQTIKEAGYKWNPETKTLEKLIVPKFKVGDKIRHRLTGEVYMVLFVLSNGCGGGVYDVAITNEIGKSIDVKEQDDYELVLNKFDISTLIPYESKVLIRNTKSGHWQPAFWGAYIIDHSDGLQHHDYLTTKGFTHYCIPYDGNEHLIGTTDDCDEYYKTWEE